MATLIEQVRALIGDDEEPYTFSDAQITVFLETYDDNVFRTSGNILMRAAVDVSLSAKLVRTDDLTVDNTKRANILFERAKILLDQADADAAGASAFNISFFPEQHILGRPSNVERWAPEGVTRPWAY